MRAPRGPTRLRVSAQRRRAEVRLGPWDDGSQAHVQTTSSMGESGRRAQSVASLPSRPVVGKPRSAALARECARCCRLGLADVHLACGLVDWQRFAPHCAFVCLCVHACVCMVRACVRACVCLNSLFLLRFAASPRETRDSMSCAVVSLMGQMSEERPSRHES